MKNFFLRKCLFDYKIRLRLKKKTKFFSWAISILLRKLFALAIKKLLVIEFLCMESLRLAFFVDKKLIVL